MEDELNGSEQFMLIAGALAMAGACFGMCLQFVLKSRCSSIKCCGIECERQVIDLTAHDAELGHVRPTFTSAT